MRSVSRLRSWLLWCVLVAGVLHVVGDFQARLKERASRRPRSVGAEAAGVPEAARASQDATQPTTSPPATLEPAGAVPPVGSAADVAANEAVMLPTPGVTEAADQQAPHASAAGPPEQARMPTAGRGGTVAKAAEAEPARVGRQESWAAIRRELVAHGVGDYRLETRGGVGKVRFSCSVPSAKNRFVSRRFEATGDDDLAVVQEVLRQIAAWQAEAEK